MLDAIARHSLWVAIWLSAVAFIDAVLGGIYRASDGANIGGFIPSSLFSALVFVFAVFVTSALKSGDPRALWWSFGALVAGGAARLCLAVWWVVWRLRSHRFHDVGHHRRCRRSGQVLWKVEKHGQVGSQGKKALCSVNAEAHVTRSSRARITHPALSQRMT